MKTAVVVDGVKDNVATILSHEVKKGSIIPIDVDGKTIEVAANVDIPFGHKVAISPIKKGETVFKYGLSIGIASQDIAVGDHVHLHNIEPMRGRGDLAKKGE